MTQANNVLETLAQPDNQLESLLIEDIAEGNQEDSLDAQPE